MLAFLLLLLLGTPQSIVAETISFDQYPAIVQFSGIPAKPNLASHPKARKYRTTLRSAAQNGPDFAGVYTIVRIGCGTSCVQLAVIDERDGTVYFPESLGSVHWAGWWQEPYGPQYKRNSRLLVVYGQANSEEAPYGVSYYEWNGTDFRLLLFELKDRGVLQ